MTTKHTYFTHALLHWHQHINPRQLPWKQEPDPYRIWLSEVILQQTRAEQGLPYYLRFTAAYPDICSLAHAAEDGVFRLWQGLGYYNRCKNMLATARYICDELNGIFPDTYEGLLALKGIGPYTASAIASFAFGRPNAVVDGNVYRVLSRYFGISTPIDSTAGKYEFTALAAVLLDKAQSAAYNQAIMDLGATVCTPRSPACPECPVAQHCSAKQSSLTSLLPVKSKKIRLRKRYFYFFLPISGDQLWIRKRGAGDIWENLHEPFLLETEAPATTEQLLQLPALAAWQPEIGTLRQAGTINQRLTHQQIESTFYFAHVIRRPAALAADGFWIPLSDIGHYAFPKTLTSFFEQVAALHAPE